MEESHRKSDSATSASKPFESLVRINSIAIDISGAMEGIESPAHEHFSIRGFVAEMRKKDLKACSPFETEGNSFGLVNNLPPLVVPRFRRWHCSSCIPNIAMKRSTDEMVVAEFGDPGTSSCQKNSEKNCLFLHSRENTGSKLGSSDNAEGEDNNPSKIIIKSIEGCKATTCSQDQTYVRDEEAGNPCSDIPEANPFHIIQTHNNTAVRPPCIVDEAENASSGSDEAFSALPYRRKPKLRSLADIMVGERNPTTDNPRPKFPSSASMQIPFTETVPVLLSPQVELDVPAEVAKASRSPPRKRKIAPEEDRGSLGVVYPYPTKRFRGLMPDAEKNYRSLENSESESEGNASVRLDFRLGAKVQRIKPKKHKAPDINKKTRAHIETGTVQMRELPKIHATPLQKHAVYNAPSFDKLGNAPSTVGEREHYFRSSLSGQHIERISNRSTTPEVEPDHDCLMPSSKSILGDCTVKEKVALDLSLNSFMDAERSSNDQASSRQFRGIPDLNEAFPLKTVTTQANEYPSYSEKRSFPLHQTMFFQDVPASSSKEKTRETREGKRQLGVSNPQNKNKNIELGASDDIPMEIVELMAKNQRERALGNSRRHHLPEGISNSSQGYHSPLFMDGRPGMINFPLAANRTGVTMTNGNMGVRQSLPSNFHQLNNCRLDMNKPEESQFRFFSSSPPSRKEARYPASSSVLPRPKPSTGAELLWPPTRENVPFHLSIPPNHSIQRNTMDVHPYSEKFHVGKPINDHIKSGKGKKVVKEGRNGSSSTSMGTLDPYSNDTIPAMQLLSLMDQRIVSGSSFDVGQKSYLDKPFSPCNHHPKVNGKENQTFPGGSFFSQNNHSKDFSRLRYNSYGSGESSKMQGQAPPEVGSSKATLAVRPAKNDTALGVCTLNRNPADFSIPDARNEFTLSAKDFKFRKRRTSKEKSRPVNIDQDRKRQRVRKNASGKEGSRKSNLGGF